MKKIVLPLVAVAAVAGIAPKFVGSQVNTSVHNFVAHINNMPGYQATLSNVEATWFTTTADIEVSLELPNYNQPIDDQTKQALEAFTVNIDFDATHGPVLFGKHSGLGWATWTATVNGEELREYAHWEKNTPIYQLTSSLGLTGTHSFVDKMPQIAIDNEEQSSLSFSGYKGAGTYNGKALIYAGQTASVTGQAPFLEMKMNNLSFDIDMQSSIKDALEQGLYDSVSKLNVADFVLTTGENSDTTSVKNAYVSAVTNVDDQFLLGGIAMSYGVEKLDTGSFSGEDMALDMEFNNVSGEVLRAWQKFAEEINHIDPQHLPVKMQEFGQQHLLTLLKAQPQINITSLRATLPQGKVTSNIHTSLVGIDALPDNLQDIGFWASHALMNGKIAGDKAAIEFVASEILKQQMLADPNAREMTPEQLEQMSQMALQQTQGMLGMLTQQGMVVATETNYESVLKFENSQLTVNGKVIPLPIPGA